MAGRNGKFSYFGLVFFVVLIVCFLGGCGSIVKLDYSSRLIGEFENEKIFYISEFEDKRPEIEKRGTTPAFKRGLGYDFFLPLPEVAFEPMPPADFLRQNLSSGVKKISKITSNPDSADYIISGSLDHLWLQQRPSVLSKISGCTALGASLLCLLVLSFGNETSSGYLLTLGMVPLFSSVGMAAGNIEYVGIMEVTINIERIKDGSLLTKSFSAEKRKKLSGFSQLEQTEFINSIFEETMDEILYYLIAGEKEKNG